MDLPTTSNLDRKPHKNRDRSMLAVIKSWVEGWIGRTRSEGQQVKNWRFLVSTTRGSSIGAVSSRATLVAARFFERGSSARSITWSLVGVWFVVVATVMAGGAVVAQDQAASPAQEPAGANMMRPRPASFSTPAVIEFKGEITHKLSVYFKNRFAAAKRAGVDLLIIRIDSPGGLKVESLEMAHMLRDCQWAYTVAIISKEAISGGSLVSLGCDEIHIAPTALFGDSGEIGFDPERLAWRLIEPKIESYLAGDAANLAASKGRSRELAEAMVDDDAVVYTRLIDQLDDDGNELGPPQREFKLAIPDVMEPLDPTWELVPESRKERFLTLSGERALELGMAQGTAATLEQLAAEFGFAADQVTVYAPNTTDSVVYFLNRPLVTGLLVLLGLIALYFELSAPGLGAGGLLAGLCAGLFFWSRFLGGTSGWLEVVLFVAGLIFIATELFVIPGFGIPGFTGLALLLASVILASQDFVLPKTDEQWNQLLTSSIVLAGAGAMFVGAAFFISKRMGSLPVFNQMVLAPSPESLPNKTLDEHGKPVAAEHPLVAVGDWGKADSLLRPAGRARFGDHSFDVVSDGAFVEQGTQVKVIRIQGNIITVAAIEDGTEEVA